MITKHTKIISPIEIENNRNKKCPECGKPMTWLEGLMVNRSVNFDYGKYVCKPCRLWCKTKESKAMRKGRRMSKQFDRNTFKWEDIQGLPIATQLGILREIQS